MTEKAIELFNKYNSLYNYASISAKICKTTAIECALIAVEEILKEIESIDSLYNLELEDNLLSYWQEVKKEIELL